MKGHRLFAALWDRFGGQFADVRAGLLSGATGRVLEIGAGPGLSLPFYTDGVVSVDATEPDPYMLRRARRRLRLSSRPIQLVQARAEHLPYRDATFDVVVSTLVLCTVADLAATLSEVRRVLKPSGRLLFFEHVRYGNPLGGLAQDAVTPLWSWFGAGCHPNRDSVKAMQGAGFQVQRLEVVRTLLPPGPEIKGIAVPM